MSLSVKSENPFNSEIAHACIAIKEKQRLRRKITMKQLCEGADIDMYNLSTIVSKRNFIDGNYFKKASEVTIIKILVTLHVSWEQSLTIARTMGYDFSDLRIKTNLLVKEAIESSSEEVINEILTKLQISSICFILNK